MREVTPGFCWPTGGLAEWAVVTPGTTATVNLRLWLALRCIEAGFCPGLCFCFSAYIPEISSSLFQRYEQEAFRLNRLIFLGYRDHSCHLSAASVC